MYGDELGEDRFAICLAVALMTRGNHAIIARLRATAGRPYKPSRCSLYPLW